MRGGAMAWILTLGAIYLALCLMLALNQRRLIYYPTPPAPSQTPTLDVMGPSGPVRVHPLNPGHPSAILYFGGNAEAVHFSGPELAEAIPGCTLYLVNYPGYGGSAGEPNETSLNAAALAVYDQIGIEHASVSLIGRSLGASVAMALSTHRPIQRMALITPFDSLVALASEHYPFFPVRWFLQDRFEGPVAAEVPSIPVVIITAEQDRVVPDRRSRALLDSLPAAEFVTIAGGHNTLNPNPSLSAFFAPICRPL
ncbi:alpha/beta hydrolase [Marinobacter hydrocarbonoclasticus]|nr:alpha/beta hydrolase [Marinobacter nauticus]